MPAPTVDLDIAALDRLAEAVRAELRLLEPESDSAAGPAHCRRFLGRQVPGRGARRAAAPHFNEERALQAAE